jgi:hypothetical protein
MLSARRTANSARLRSTSIDELFAEDRPLPEVLQEVARQGAQLLMQAALEAEVTEFLGRDRYQRAAAGEQSRDGSRNGYRLFAAEDQLTAVVMERMLAGLATRRHVEAGEPVGVAVAEQQATATSRSAVSRRFIAATKTALAELLARDLTLFNIKLLMVDGEHLADHLAVSLWRSPRTVRRYRSGCGKARPRTPPWSRRCSRIWSPGAWTPPTGCRSSSTARRPCPRR